MRIVGGYPNLIRINRGPRPLELKKKDFFYLGKDVCVWPQAKLINTRMISLGHRSIIDDFVFLFAGGEPVFIGKFVHIASHSTITGRGGLTMEDFSGISPGVRVMTSNEDFSAGTSLTSSSIPPEFRTLESARVTIKKHALVGCNSVILPGITIGEGCAVGANSLVDRDLPAWKVCFGSPARPIKVRPRKKILDLEQEFIRKFPQYLKD